VHEHAPDAAHLADDPLDHAAHVGSGPLRELLVAQGGEPGPLLRELLARERDPPDPSGRRRQARAEQVLHLGGDVVGVLRDGRDREHEGQDEHDEDRDVITTTATHRRSPARLWTPIISGGRDHLHRRPDDRCGEWLAPTGTRGSEPDDEDGERDAHEVFRGRRLCHARGSLGSRRAPGAPVLGRDARAMGRNPTHGTCRPRRRRTFPAQTCSPRSFIRASTTRRPRRRRRLEGALSYDDELVIRRASFRALDRQAQTAARGQALRAGSGREEARDLEHEGPAEERGVRRDREGRHDGAVRVRIREAPLEQEAHGRRGRIEGEMEARAEVERPGRVLGVADQEQWRRAGVRRVQLEARVAEGRGAVREQGRGPPPG
jgi:hypothetical protein